MFRFANVKTLVRVYVASGELSYKIGRLFDVPRVTRRKQQRRARTAKDGKSKPKVHMTTPHAVKLCVWESSGGWLVA